MASHREITHEFPPFFRVFSNGDVERYTPISHVPASFHRSENGLRSKDVTISLNPDVSARLFLPQLPSKNRKLPILVYFHGSAWCVESAFSKLYDDFVSSLAAQAGVLAISVEYRLAPEAPIPAAYHDCWSALQWIIRQSKVVDAEPWISEYGDFDQIFLSGDSAGGNLAHHMAMCAGGAPSFESDVGNEFEVKVSGIVVTHPFFLDSPLWDFFCPESPSMENPLTNLAAPSSPPIEKMGCQRVLVFIAGKDFLGDRGRWYGEFLEKSEWDGELEVVEHEGEGHVFHLYKPECENAKDLVKRMVVFMNPDNN